MDSSRLSPLAMLASAVDVHWPSMLLVGVCSTAAIASRLTHSDSVWRSRLSLLSSPTILITLPVYVWGCLAAFELIRFHDVLARTAASDVEGFLIHVFSIFMSQFVALIVVLLPGTIGALLSGVPARARDFTGALWAIAMVAVDHPCS